MTKKLWPIWRDGLLALILHGVGIQVMTHFRLLDQLLSPSPESSLIGIGVGVSFICLRLFILLFLPGWLLARSFWVLSAPRAAVKEREPAVASADPV